MSIKVCGLGPAGPELISNETQIALSESSELYVRTKYHPACEGLTYLESFDSVYEQNKSFEEIYTEITETLLEVGSDKDIVYATPGSPLILEDVVKNLASQTQVEVEILPALSFLDLCWQRLGVDPVKSSVTLTDIQSFNASQYSSSPLLVTQVFNLDLAAKLKLSYQDDFEVVLLQDLGSPTELVKKMDIADLDKIVPTNRTSVYIPSPGVAEHNDFGDLVNLISRLRKECKWDASQTHDSLVQYLTEELSLIHI